MKKRIISFILVIATMVIVITLFTGCENNTSVAAPGGNSSVFAEGKVYAITGEFDYSAHGGFDFGTLFVEILEVDGNWIRVDVLEDDGVKRALRQSNINRGKEEGYFADIWINTVKIHHIMTEPDFF